jgi:hypothetical protein
MQKTTAYRAYAIYADYDGNAPDSGDVVLVETKALAIEVCAKLNEDPRAYVICCVDGWEHSKRWEQRPVVTEHAGVILTTFDAAMAVFED